MPQDPIAQAMGIQPIQVETTTELSINKQADEFKTSKDTLEQVIDIGLKKLGEMSDIAASSQDSRDYRVVKELIEAIAAASKDLVEIKRTDVETKIKEAQGTEPKKVINQNLIMTTDDLAKMLESKMKK